MRRAVVGPLISLAVIVVALAIGGALNSVPANGRVVDDWKGTPLADAEVHFGGRQVTTDANGNFDLGLVPREAKLWALKRAGYARVDFTPDQHEVRLQPATLSVQVNDSQTGKGVPNPEARKGDQRLQRGSDTGSMAIAPHPGKDVAFVICAKDHAQQEVSSDGTTLTVTLDPQQAADCPLLPGESPSPSPSPSPSASPSPSPSPSGSHSPTPSPSPSP